MRMRFIVLFSLLALFYSCHGDFCKLGDKYVYCEYTIAKSPTNSRWTKDGKYVPYQVVIGRKVINYCHNDDYIIAQQIVNGDCEKEPRYWIIRIADDTIWGPLNKDSFDIMCKEQNVKIYL